MKNRAYSLWKDGKIIVHGATEQAIESYLRTEVGTTLKKAVKMGYTLTIS